MEREPPSTSATWPSGAANHCLGGIIYMFKKSMLVAAMAATLGTATLSTTASAADPVLGAIVGGGMGAAIGHGVNGHNGAWTGAAIGSVLGAAVAADQNRYYGDGYYGAPGPSYYGQSNGYYAPAPAPAYYDSGPAYYGPPAVAYQPAPVYVAPYYGPRVTYTYVDSHYRGGRYYDGRHDGRWNGYRHDVRSDGYRHDGRGETRRQWRDDRRH